MASAEAREDRTTSRTGTLQSSTAWMVCRIASRSAITTWDSNLDPAGVKPQRAPNSPIAVHHVVHGHHVEKLLVLRYLRVGTLNQLLHVLPGYGVSVGVGVDHSRGVGKQAVEAPAMLT